MGDWSTFSGANQGYVLELYERYRRDPRSVDEAARAYFTDWSPPDEQIDVTSEATLQLVVGVANLAESIRRYGHLVAQIDPLGTPRAPDPALELETHGVTEDDLRRLPASLVSGPAAEGAANAWEAIERLRGIYCSTTGYDYAHIFVREERHWLREAAERARFRAPHDPIDPVALLARLTEVETFERFLHRTFPGKTRFSIEGLDMLVPVLDEVIGEAAEANIHHMIIGMAHRGRLNVLAHVLHKPYAQIKDPIRARQFHDLAWSGDVKYHSGAHRALLDGAEVDLTISMPPNPSHLEAIDPVVLGMARAAGTSVDRRGAPHFDLRRTLPILIHGDAAFPGQGVVGETLNFSALPGYETGGTIHIISNNQIGFTTVAEDLYSPLYASGLARGFKIPIVHVNADDVEACIAAARLAFAYRARFQRDFLIDLVGYRRYGHNEGDEPAFTQPLMSRRIVEHPTVRETWARTLEERSVLAPGLANQLVRDRMETLQQVFETLDPQRDLVEALPPPPEKGAVRQTRTDVPLERLRALNASLLTLPEGLQVHRKLERGLERRRHVLDDPDERTVDWAAAEELAFASILADGVAIRLTGEDVERGTFSHRHAVFHDPRTGETFVPLQAMEQARAAFEIHNSPLTENAVVGFEYGYSVQAPDRLVIWEAQYGDFINGAQVIIDEFVVSARSKWGQTPSLVLLLPHGHEGQGPDHASARPERFLQLATDINLRLANCTTAAQYFHLLRRQAALLRSYPLPLIVLTPKSLLRHPFVMSTPRELSEGRWQRVISDEAARTRASEVQRIIFCTGKVAVDLLTSDQRQATPDVAIVRLEQIFPFPTAEVTAVFKTFSRASEVAWVQEEPENMGAWEFMRPLIGELAGGRRRLRYVGRPRSSSPAEGSAAQHAIAQAAIVDEAFRLTTVTGAASTKRAPVKSVPVKS